jgi:hypothetical protein
MTTSFASDKKLLSDLLNEIQKGQLQLPDFQRGWVWDDSHIRSLLTSISLSYPIGSLMTLETGNPAVKFKARPIESVPETNTSPAQLILDGQQRMTSLFQSLKSGKVVTTQDSRKKVIKRWYYVDIRRAIDPELDREDAFVSLPEDRMVRNFRGEVLEDYSTAEKEQEAGLFPVNLFLSDYEDWAEAYRDQSSSHKDTWKEFRKGILVAFQQYQMPIITLGKLTPKDAVCQVFEKVNTGGVPLSVFELLTASFAAESDSFELRTDWFQVRLPALKQYKVLTTVESTDFLQAVTLLASRQRRLNRIAGGTAEESAPPISCKRKDVLDLTLAEYQRWADPVMQGFRLAAKLLHGQKFFTVRDLPYRTQLVPLAATLAALDEAGKADTLATRQKLAQWFWCGVFGELYSSATETRFAKDLPELLGWVAGGPQPDTTRDAEFAPSRLLTLKTRNSAAYKGLYALLLRDGCQDFRTGEPADDVSYFDEKIDIHHIFPQDWCKAQGLPKQRWDCIVNKTPLTARTNRMIGGVPPSDYLMTIQRKERIDLAVLDSILTSHVINVNTLRQDDFETFFRLREQALLDRISQAMGKPVMQRGLLIEADFGDEGEELVEA